MCGLSARPFYSLIRRQCPAFEIPHKERQKVAGPSSTISLPGSNLFSSSSRLVSTGRRPTLRTYATQRIALRPPPACSLSHSTRSFCSFNSRLPKQQPSPSLPFRQRDLDAATSNQQTGCRACLQSLTRHRITIATLVTTTRHDTTRLCSCGNCHGGTALHCAAHRLSLSSSLLYSGNTQSSIYSTRGGRFSPQHKLGLSHLVRSVLFWSGLVWLSGRSDLQW